MLIPAIFLENRYSETKLGDGSMEIRIIANVNITCWINSDFMRLKSLGWFPVHFSILITFINSMGCRIPVIFWMPGFSTHRLEKQKIYCVYCSTIAICEIVFKQMYILYIDSHFTTNISNNFVLIYWYKLWNISYTSRWMKKNLDTDENVMVVIFLNEK